MRKRASKKQIFTCLLLFSLFISSYTGLLTTPAITSADMFAGSSLSGGSSLAAMNGGINAAHADCLAAIDSLIESFSLSLNQSRWLAAQDNLAVFTAITALMMGLVCSARRTQGFALPFNSLSITIFLHEKDGMK